MNVAGIANQIGNIASGISNDQHLSVDELINEMSKYQGVEPQRDVIAEVLTAMCKQTASSTNKDLHDAIVSSIHSNIINAFLTSVVANNRKRITPMLLGIEVPEENFARDQSAESAESVAETNTPPVAETYIPPAAGSGEDQGIVKSPNFANIGTMLKSAMTTQSGGADTDEISTDIRRVLTASSELLIKGVIDDTKHSTGADSLIFDRLFRNVINRSATAIQDKEYNNKNYEMFVGSLTPISDSIRGKIYSSTKKILVAHLDNLQKYIKFLPTDQASAGDDSLKTFLETLYQLYYVECNNTSNLTTINLPKTIHDRIVGYVDYIQNSQEDKTNIARILGSLTAEQSKNVVKDVIGASQDEVILESFKKLFEQEGEPDASRINKMTETIRNTGSKVMNLFTRNPTRVVPAAVPTVGGKRTTRRKLSKIKQSRGKQSRCKQSRGKQSIRRIR